MELNVIMKTMTTNAYLERKLKETRAHVFYNFSDVDREVCEG